MANKQNDTCNILVWTDTVRRSRGLVYAMGYSIGTDALETHQALGDGPAGGSLPITLQFNNPELYELSDVDRMRLLRYYLGLETPYLPQSESGAGFSGFDAPTLSSVEDLEELDMGADGEVETKIEARLLEPGNQETTETQIVFHIPDTQLVGAPENETKPPSSPDSGETHPAFSERVMAYFKNLLSTIGRLNHEVQYDAVIVLLDIETPEDTILKLFRSALTMWKDTSPLKANARVIFAMANSAASVSVLPVAYDWGEIKQLIEEGSRQGDPFWRNTMHFDQPSTLLSSAHQSFLKVITSEAHAGQLESFGTLLQALGAQARFVFCDFEGFDVATRTTAHEIKHASSPDYASGIFSERNLNMWTQAQRKASPKPTWPDPSGYYQDAFKSWRMFNIGTVLMTALNPGPLNEATGAYERLE